MKRTEDVDQQIRPGVQRTQAALGLQIGRQPDRQRVRAALGARHHQRDLGRGGEIGRPQHCEGLTEAAGAGSATRIEYLRLAHAAPDPQHQERRRQPDPKHHAPGDDIGQHREHQRVQQRRRAPAHRPATLHESDRPPAIFVADDFAHQYGAGRPFGAKAEALQRAQHEQLLEILREAAQEGEDRVPQHGDLQDADPAIAVAQGPGEPAAKRRDHQRDRSEQAGFAARDVPGREQRRDDEAVDLHIERVQRPTAKTARHGSPLTRREFPHPLEHRFPHPALFFLNLCRMLAVLLLLFLLVSYPPLGCHCFSGNCGNVIVATAPNTRQAVIVQSAMR
jgi:hypothetical protein